MFIKRNHPLYKKITTVGQQLQHNGISYSVVDETFGQYGLVLKYRTWNLRI